MGSALLLSSAPADFDAVVVEPVRSMCWDVTTFESYLAANPDGEAMAWNAMKT